jgi:hypothetical protein
MQIVTSYGFSFFCVDQISKALISEQLFDGFRMPLTAIDCYVAAMLPRSASTTD